MSAGDERRRTAAATTTTSPAALGAAARLTPRRIAALAAFVITLVVHAIAIPAQGLTDDDDFYAPAGIRYAEWLGDAVTSPGTAFSRASVDAAFKANHEHPPFAKFVFGVAHASTSFVYGDLDAARFGCALFAAALALTLVLLAWKPLGPAVACGAPALLLSLPRFFFHSEVATLDVPVATAVVVVTALYFAASEQRAARFLPALTGVAFGVACLTKLNAPFAVIPCALWSILAAWRGFRVDGGVLVIPPVPRALPWMIVLGPVLFVALWPWLWFDTFTRIGAYIAFHLNHYPIFLFYDGEIWNDPFAPPHSVLFLGFGALPATVAALGLIGAARAARAVLRMTRDAADAGDRLRALLLLQAAFSLLVTMNPGIPRYGGEKLFMPFFPLFCLLAADGAVVVSSILRAPRRARAAAAAVLVVAALPGFIGTARFGGGYALSYYGELAGGLRGAVARGYERTYYDVADKDLARFLDGLAQEQPGLRVHFEPNHKEYARTYRWLKRDGVISGKLVLDEDRARADVVVLTHERRWVTYPALKAELEAQLTPIREKAIDGVPLYTVFRRR